MVEINSYVLFLVSHAHFFLNLMVNYGRAMVSTKSHDLKQKQKVMT